MRPRSNSHFPVVMMAAVVAATASVQAQQRPNIVLFMVDDMGWQDTSLPFWTKPTPLNNTYETPNMERLARQGMLFSGAYASAISSPSRCSLLTGSNAARHRVTNWTFRKDQMTDGEDDLLAPPDWNYNGVCQVEGTPNTFVARSFVDILHSAGYHTIHCGKAHWGAQDTPGESPLHFGFEVNIAGHAAGGPATYLSERNFGHDADGRPAAQFAIPGLQKYWGTGTFLTEALTQEALGALQSWNERYNVITSLRDNEIIKEKEENELRPFFLYLSHYAVHIPIDRDMRFYEKYRRKGLSEKEAAYASLIEGMDKSLGDILDWLELNGQVDNSIIIFMSDNGGYASGLEWRDEPLFTQNAPLRSGKGSLLEGGIREPMIVRWPGVARAGSRCDSYLIIEDFFPTILEMAGIRRYQVPQTIDGRSFVPLLRGKGEPSKDRCLVWNYPHVWGNKGPGIDLNCAIREGDWKLIYSYKTGQKELYNIRHDIGEEHNLAAEQPKLVRRLSRHLGKRLRAMNAQRPTVKATGNPCPWPDE
ncbi:MAG: sulfatase [Bacteroidaceae bacterium]|nr:sulfatase [Bacteroidaceae bacterium]